MALTIMHSSLLPFLSEIDLVDLVIHHSAGLTVLHSRQESPALLAGNEELFPVVCVREAGATGQDSVLFEDFDVLCFEESAEGWA